MTPNIIIGNRPERLPRLREELTTQGIDNPKYWEGVHDVRSVVSSINLSHKQIVEWARDNYLDKVLIMEDDVKFFGAGAFDYFIATIPEYFDIYLGGIYVGNIDENNEVKVFSGMHCYIVHECFYDTFLNTPTDKHIDRALGGLGKYVVCDPFIAEQYDGFSSNTGKDETYTRLMNGRRKFNEV